MLISRIVGSQSHAITRPFITFCRTQSWTANAAHQRLSPAKVTLETGRCPWSAAPESAAKYSCAALLTPALSLEAPERDSLPTFLCRSVIFCQYPFSHPRTEAEAREHLPNCCYLTASLCNGDDHSYETSTQASPFKLVTYFELGGTKQRLINGSYAAAIGDSETA